MKKFDNHVTKLQKEMIDITNNLNKFRNKNHKTISLIINNLNVLSNEIEDNNIQNDSNTSNKNSQIENSKNSIDIYSDKKKYNLLSLQPKNENIKIRTNSNFYKNKNDNYMTYLINNKNNCIDKINSNKIQTPKKQYLQKKNMNNYQNNDYNNELKESKISRTYKKYNNKNKIMNKTNSLNINKEYTKEIFNLHNPLVKEKNHLKTELENKKRRKNNTVTNLLFNKNKKDFIYFNRNKQNYLKQNNTNKIQTCYFTQRNHNIYNNISGRKINTFEELNIIKNFNYNEHKENNKNNCFNDSDYNILNNYLEEEECSQKNENEDNNSEINELMKILKLKNTNDLKKKLKELYTAKNFTKKVISLFNKNSKNKNKEKINLDEILYWISSNLNYKKEEDKYKNYCNQLMKYNHINNFEEFKLFIDQILNKNIQNNNFLGGVKRILSTNIDDKSDFNFIDINNF